MRLATTMKRTQWRQAHGWWRHPSGPASHQRLVSCKQAALSACIKCDGPPPSAPPRRPGGDGSGHVRAAVAWAGCRQHRRDGDTARLQRHGWSCKGKGTDRRLLFEFMTSGWLPGFSFPFTNWTVGKAGGEREAPHAPERSQPHGQRGLPPPRPFLLHRTGPTQSSS
jgi:hypothetical protein